ncbi:MAG: type II secretion system F family protein, partial [Nanoarchaeota archaeon]
VRTGTPISKSIMNLKDKDYGTLTRHVKNLANQIMIGISVKDALQIFAEEVDNNVVTRAVGLISEAEKGGGSIEKTLQSVASSTLQIDKIQKERKAVIYNLAVQGYIIFFIFVIIMLILEFKIVGIAASISTDFSTVSAQTAISRPDFSRPFLILLLEQGFFTGLVIGKLSEGNFKSGIKHSFAMVVFALLISTGARAFFG